jgi:hypothetical protein
MESQEPPTSDSPVGVTIVVRSETVITAFRGVSPAAIAESVTADALCKVVEALPKGASLDLIVQTAAMYHALDSCADIVRHGWDVDQYCRHEGWKMVMTLWKERQIQATVRAFEEDGQDSENASLSGLALRKAIQAVRDGIHDRDPQEGGQ